MGFLTGLEKMVRRGEPLARHTWLKLGGAAEFFAEPETPDELVALVKRCRDEDMPCRLLGGGSNLLVRDEGVPGVVVRLSAEAFNKIEVRGQTVTAGGGAKLGHVISSSVREGLAGLEQLVGIPGTVGGALYVNAGGHGGDIGQWSHEATVMTRTGQIESRRRDDLHFAYRKSSLDELVILSAQFKLEQEAPKELTRRMQQVWIVQKSSQPMGDQNAGCIFKNPRGMTASNLIEQAGLKGARVGEVRVSDRHANFLIADRGATSNDVLRLIELVRSRVAERLGVALENQIEIW